VVLSLDTEVEYEVQMMKKSLYAQIGIQEYATETKWRNPCASFIIRDVFCQECSECRDVDLCIFPTLDEDQEMRWICDECSAPYDPEYIERRLVDSIQRTCVRYQLQDLRCSKTGRIATRVLSHQSDCSAILKPDISRSDVLSELLILRNLAQYYELEWLMETTEFSMNLNF